MIEALPKLGYLLFNRDDEATLTHVMWTMSYLLPGLVVEDVLVARFCQMLRWVDV